LSKHVLDKKDAWDTASAVAKPAHRPAWPG